MCQDRGGRNTKEGGVRNTKEGVFVLVFGGNEFHLLVCIILYTVYHGVTLDLFGEDNHL